MAGNAGRNLERKTPPASPSVATQSDFSSQSALQNLAFNINTRVFEEKNEELEERKSELQIYLSGIKDAMARVSLMDGFKEAKAAQMLSAAAKKVEESLVKKINLIDQLVATSVFPDELLKKTYESSKALSAKKQICLDALNKLAKEEFKKIESNLTQESLANFKEHFSRVAQIKEGALVEKPAKSKFIPVSALKDTFRKFPENLKVRAKELLKIKLPVDDESFMQVSTKLESGIGADLLAHLNLLNQALIKTEKTPGHNKVLYTSLMHQFDEMTLQLTEVQKHARAEEKKQGEVKAKQDKMQKIKADVGLAHSAVFTLAKTKSDSQKNFIKSIYEVLTIANASGLKIEGYHKDAKGEASSKDIRKLFVELGKKCADLCEPDGAIHEQVIANFVREKKAESLSIKEMTRLVAEKREKVVEPKDLKYLRMPNQFIAGCYLILNDKKLKGFSGGREEIEALTRSILNEYNDCLRYDRSYKEVLGLIIPFVDVKAVPSLENPVDLMTQLQVLQKKMFEEKWAFNEEDLKTDNRFKAIIFIALKDMNSAHPDLLTTVSKLKDLWDGTRMDAKSTETKKREDDAKTDSEVIDLIANFIKLVRDESYFAEDKSKSKVLQDVSNIMSGGGNQIHKINQVFLKLKPHVEGLQLKIDFKSLKVGDIQSIPNQADKTFATLYFGLKDKSNRVENLTSAIKSIKPFLKPHVARYQR